MIICHQVAQVYKFDNPYNNRLELAHHYYYSQFMIVHCLTSLDYSSGSRGPKLVELTISKFPTPTLIHPDNLLSTKVNIWAVCEVFLTQCTDLCCNCMLDMTLLNVVTAGLTIMCHGVSVCVQVSVLIMFC